MKIFTFNLEKHKRRAYYEDAQGLIQSETRFMMNCYKAKVDSGMPPHEAKQSCIEEYQSKEKWALKYAKNKRKR